MQFKHYLITACIFMLTFFSANENLKASCNWQSKAITLTAFDSCFSRNNTIIAWLNFGSKLSCYSYEWTLNGNKIGWNSSFFSTGVTSNGTYNLCVKIKDTCNNCDTTFCQSVIVNCIKPKCDWYKRNLSFTVSDSCSGNNGFLNAYVSPVAGCYKYNWALMGKNVATTSNGAISLQVYNKWTYDVCLTLEDTCNNCDTTLCSSATINCGGLSCNWKSRNLMLTLYDSCFNDKKGTYLVKAAVANPDSCYSYELMMYMHTDSSAYSISGIYNGPWTRDICMKVTNKCSGCDTFVCITYHPNCGIPDCYWDPQSLEITIDDSCLSSDSTGVALIKARIAHPDSCYTYELRMPNMTDSGYQYVSGLLYGPYTTDICMTVTNNCTGCDTFVCITYKSECSTLKTQNQQRAAIFPYPNPSQGMLYLKGLNQPAAFVISDLTGRKITEGNLKDSDTPINLRGISKGIYNLNIKNKNYRIVLE